MDLFAAACLSIGFLALLLGFHVGRRAGRREGIDVLSLYVKRAHVRLHRLAAIERHYPSTDGISADPCPPHCPDSWDLAEAKEFIGI